MLLLGLPHIHVREGASPEPRKKVERTHVCKREGVTRLDDLTRHRFCHRSCHSRRHRES